jgi:hypothetical protein
MIMSLLDKFKGNFVDNDDDEELDEEEGMEEEGIRSRTAEISGCTQQRRPRRSTGPPDIQTIYHGRRFP